MLARTCLVGPAPSFYIGFLYNLQSEHRVLSAPASLQARPPPSDLRLDHRLQTSGSTTASSRSSGSISCLL
ncbi:hypothetical protein SRHO_G00284120 [Serrasalmus rhombeus]